MLSIRQEIQEVTAMNRLRLLLVLACVPVLSVVSGCANDCDTFCARQGRYIDRCLPQFDSVWTDLNPDWQNRGDFVGACNEQVDDRIAEDTEATCANAADDASRRVCETTVREGIYDSCSDDLNKFQQSCTDYWRGEVDFLPEGFDPPPFPGDDDDDSAVGDDDDSAVGDDDDSAVGDDDDSAVGDDDDSAAGDDDDSAAGDDDDSAVGDDDDSAVGDDDDSAAR
jgi:hypothetical protein